MMATRAHAPHTYHGLRTPNEAFFSLKSRTFGLGQAIWANKFWGIWDIFGQTISTHFGTVSFPLFNHYFYKKLSFCIHIPNIYLGNRDLAIVCP